jgi:hypothetical protein
MKIRIGIALAALLGLLAVAAVADAYKLPFGIAKGEIRRETAQLPPAVPTSGRLRRAARRRKWQSLRLRRDRPSAGEPLRNRDPPQARRLRVVLSAA